MTSLIPTSCLLVGGLLLRRSAIPPETCSPSQRSSSACPCRAKFPWPVLPVPGNCSGWPDSDASSVSLPLVSRPFPHRRCLPLLPYPWLPVPVKVSPAWRSILCGNWVKPTHSGLSCPFSAGPIFPENTCHHTHSAPNYPSQHVRLRQDSVEGKKPHNIKQRKTEHSRRFEPRKKEEETITRSEESGRSPVGSSASWNRKVQQTPPKAGPLLWVPNATEPFLLAGMIHMILRGLKWLEAGFLFPPRDWSQAMGVRVLNPNCWTTPGTSAQWQVLALRPCRNELPQRRKVVKHVKCLLRRKRVQYVCIDTQADSVLRPRGSLNHLYGAFLPDFLGPIIFPCLVPSLYLVDLRILLRVRSHLSGKVDYSKEAYGVGIIHLLTSKEFFCACVVGMISLTSRMKSILSLLLFGRAQPLLLSSCYLSLRASILRWQTPAAEPGASLSLPHTFHPLGSPLSPGHGAQPAPSPNKQPCFTSVNLPMSLPERDNAIGHVKGKRALSIV